VESIINKKYLESSDPYS